MAADPPPHFKALVVALDPDDDGGFTCRGRCDVEDLHIGDWYPIEDPPR